MRHCLIFGVALVALSALTVAEEAIDPGRAANTIILDETGVKNLKIQAVSVEPRVFETTVFAIGRVEETPSSRSVLSSRISGRAVKVNAFVGDFVEKGATLVEVESRQPGDPPPVIPLKAAQGGLVIASHVKVGQPVEPERCIVETPLPVQQRTGGDAQWGVERESGKFDGVHRRRWLRSRKFRSFIVVPRVTLVKIVAWQGAGHLASAACWFRLFED